MEKKKSSPWLLLAAGIVIGSGIGVILLFGFNLANTDVETWVNKMVSAPAPRVGAPAPDFALTSLEGEIVRLSDYQGKPVVLNFWATWCGPCVKEMPAIQRYFDELNGKFEVLAINADETEFVVRQFVEDIGITFPVLLDPGSLVQQRYQIRGYPTTYILDAQGVVQFQHIGFMEKSQLVNYIFRVEGGK